MPDMIPKVEIPKFAFLSSFFFLLGICLWGGGDWIISLLFFPLGGLELFISEEDESSVEVFLGVSSNPELSVLIRLLVVTMRQNK